MSLNLPEFGSLSERRIRSSRRYGPLPSFTPYCIATCAKARYRLEAPAIWPPRFSGHIEDGLWSLKPVNEALLRRTSLLMFAASADIHLRTADAVHLRRLRRSVSARCGP